MSILTARPATRCEMLDCKTRHSLSIDPQHDAYNWDAVARGRGSARLIFKTVVDPAFLRRAAVPKDGTCCLNGGNSSYVHA